MFIKELIIPSLFFLFMLWGMFSKPDRVGEFFPNVDNISFNSLLEKHRLKKFYNFFSNLLKISLSLFGSVVLYIWTSGRAYYGVFYYLSLAIGCISFFVLFIVRCPRCNSVIILQQVNNHFFNPPSYCKKCGYPAAENAHTKSEVAVRPIFKWLFYIFFALPLVLMILVFIYLFISGDLKWG